VGAVWAWGWPWVQFALSQLWGIFDHLARFLAVWWILRAGWQGETEQ
jgi:hypothetical protein